VSNKTVFLVRVRDTGESTLGWLVADNHIIAYTLEDAWKDNAPFKSAIPCGTYPVVPWKSPTKGNVYLVTGVPGRDHVLIHIGNDAQDTEGCILVGETFTDYPTRTFLNRSEAAMNVIRAHFSSEPFTLKIRCQSLYIPGEHEAIHIAAKQEEEDEQRTRVGTESTN